jgi:hypothetical protein
MKGLSDGIEPSGLMRNTPPTRALPVVAVFCSMRAGVPMRPRFRSPVTP